MPILWRAATTSAAAPAAAKASVVVADREEEASSSHPENAQGCGIVSRSLPARLQLTCRISFSLLPTLLLFVLQARFFFFLFFYALTTRAFFCCSCLPWNDEFSGSASRHKFVANSIVKICQARVSCVRERSSVEAQRATCKGRETTTGSDSFDDFLLNLLKA